MTGPSKATLDREPEGPAARLHVGTSGWHYEHWLGRFYPEELPKARWLAHYAAHFQTAEINNSFYGMPSAATLASWREQVPEGFIFAAKAHRFITHMKKLKDTEASVARMLERFDVLGDTLGPILFQLPPRWHLDHERLITFLRTLPSGYRYAFEFRDGTWFEPSVYDALAEHGAAFCIYHLAGRQSPKVVTADFVYVRLHGPGGAYQGRYGTRGLRPWVRDCLDWLEAGREVFVYFDNDERAYAVADALELNRRLTSALAPASAERMGAA